MSKCTKCGKYHGASYRLRSKKHNFDLGHDSYYYALERYHNLIEFFGNTAIELVKTCMYCKNQERTIKEIK